MANPRIEVEIGAVIDGLKQGFGESVKIIDKLEEQARDLEKALRSATDLQTIQRLNVDLAKNRDALAQLRASGIEPLTKATSQYNSVGTDFARIIQDAPFGIIGVGNNITQLAGSFQNLKNQTGSTGQALKTAFSSIFSSANLLVLGVSAVTTALTVYSMTAKDTGGSVDDLKQSQDDFNESLKETDQLLKQGFFNQLLKDVGLLQTQEIGGRLIDVPAFESANQVLEKLGGTIDRLNKNELQALQSFLGEKLADATRIATNATSELEKSLALDDFDIYQALLKEVNTQLAFYKTSTEKSTKATKDLKQEIFTFSTNPLVDAYFEAIRVGAEFEESLFRVASKLTGLEGETRKDIKFFDIQLPPEEQFTETAIQLKTFADFYKEVQNETSQTSQLLIDSFANLGAQISSSLNISNDALRGFVGTLLSNTPKIIQAIFQTAAANKLASEANIASSKKGALANGIFMATETGKTLGPIGLALLPVLIGGVVALISGAFRKTGSGGSSVGASGLGAGTSFTSGATGFGFAQNREIRGELVARGQDLVYVFNEANTRINKG